MVISVLLNTAVHFILQVDRDLGRSHTYGVLKSKVKLEVTDMKYHSEITKEIREIRTEGILRNSLKFQIS